MEKYSIDSCVRGYHIYSDIWEASVGEQLPCELEGGNSADPFAVTIKRSGAVVISWSKVAIKSHACQPCLSIIVNTSTTTRLRLG